MTTTGMGLDRRGREGGGQRGGRAGERVRGEGEPGRMREREGENDRS